MKAATLPEGFQAVRSAMRLICSRCGAHIECLHPETPLALAFIRFHQELHA